MDLSKFLSEVDGFTDRMDAKELRQFIHDFARQFPETKREEFLEKLGEKMSST